MRVQIRAWLSVIRPISSLLTILLVSLLQCIKVSILRTLCETDLDWVPNHFIYFYIIDKLHFYFLISFWYSHFLLLPTNPLAHNWELSLSLLLACYSKHLFCPFQCKIPYHYQTNCCIYRLMTRFIIFVDFFCISQKHIKTPT